MNSKKLEKMLQILHAWNTPRPWWENTDYNEYQVMLSIVFSNRTSYKAVRRLIGGFTRHCPSFECIASLGLEELQWMLKPLGLARMRARLLKDLASMIIEAGGLDAFLRLPPEKARELLLRVTGIGPKTADMILVALFKKRYFVVDTHILRIMKRLGVLEQDINSLYRARKLLEPHIPEDLRVELHTKLILLGRETCRPRKPKCSQCILRQICRYASSKQSRREKKTLGSPAFLKEPVTSMR